MLHTRIFRPCLAFCLPLYLIAVTAAAAKKPDYVVATIDGRQYRVRDDRQPALYTADFGDCRGGSLINVTRFDAAYYRDNMTVLFHLEGESALHREDIMMSIGVYAYGESRFALTFNPCSANIDSACPVKAGVPIAAAGIIPINQNDVAGIPDLALYIPDFEGQAILRIFSNSTQLEIGCFAAQITNGNTFRQKTEVGIVLGVFTLIAMVASFAPAIYGDDIVEMRKHYAHSLSVMVVFAVWHHIYFSGALSVNWPSALVAFWSNYAWTAGMIYSERMQNTINNFIGSNKGNTSQVGAAGTGESNPGLGGGYDITAIYKRGLVNPDSGFSYTGEPVKPGLPLPGNFSGFAGALAQERIPASNAFMTCLLWSLVLVACIVGSIVALKLVLESLSKTKLIKGNRLIFFRVHWIRYTALAVLRAGFIGFFMIAFVSMFQFSYLKSPGLVAVACIVFLVVVFGIGSAAVLACYRRISTGQYVCEPDKWNIEGTKVWKVIPWYTLSRQSKIPRSEDRIYAGSIPWWIIRPSSGDKSVHDDESFIQSFGWLAARYRRTRWWFFAVWLVYEFVRACFLAGASTQPLLQVFGILGVEVVGFIGIVYLHPFQGQRLNVILVYMLGFSKIATTGLSAAFDTKFNLPRIPATIVGIIIIVIQGLLTISLLIAIFIGAITSYFSITRHQETIRPRGWLPTREKYLKRLDDRASDLPRPRPMRVQSVPEVQIQSGPYFSVNQVKRIPKVEDEEEEFSPETHNLSASRLTPSSGNQAADGEQPPQRSRAASDLSQMSHSAPPRAAGLHRPSWNSQDLAEARRKGRARPNSKTTLSTRDSPDRLKNNATPRLDTQTEGEETASRQPSPLSGDASRSNTPASSSIPHPQDNDNFPYRQSGSRPSIPPRSILRPTSGDEDRPSVPPRSTLRPTTGEESSEEQGLSIPRKSSKRLVMEGEEA
ncbi:TRP-domain-containing protein [Ophiobolus disseminans]|uniref:TRP-domain-containing protein n=1 Tax=Ophiobolus disseminans TaxID=1469910 RepID=A0A6A7A9N4_9PLEO|nr:TRP-domain-containing protein [Ophiobolus disseminans]